MLRIETAMVILAGLIAWLHPSFGAQWFERIEVMFSRLANRRVLAVAVIGFSTLVLRIAVLPVEPIPEPAVHDEFSYLLQADTFAHGRLTNPTPPMWEHFETFHEIFQPTYCSKFFPGQGLFLALGQVVFGHPFWGIWLTSGLMCAAITWMLQGWFSPGWAFLGGSIALLRFGVFGYWADSYWGGNVAAIGGALVLGALPRIKSSQRPRNSLLMGLGLALLANSRPWEGLVLSLPVALILLTWMLRRPRQPFKLLLQRVVIPLALVLGVTACWLGYYCWRTTGNPLRTPYQVYEETYAVAPVMIWQHVRPVPPYRHDILRKMEANQEIADYNAFRAPIGHIFRIYSVVGFFLGPILILPFLMLFLALPSGFSYRNISQPVRVLLLVLAVFTAATEMATFYSPHYSAPITALIIAFVLFAIRRIRDWNRGGLFLARAIPLACVMAFVLRTGAVPLHISPTQSTAYFWFQFFEFRPKGWFPRTDIQAELLKAPGNHLVIVRYNQEHEPFPDWVYNDADINRSRIVWARDMNAAENQDLLDYFKGRQAWLLEPDQKPIRLQPYIHQHSAEAKSSRDILK
jgi:hypothetical protein